jgi:hypothetical protein
MNRSWTNLKSVTTDRNQFSAAAPSAKLSPSVVCSRVLKIPSGITPSWAGARDRIDRHLSAATRRVADRLAHLLGPLTVPTGAIPARIRAVAQAAGRRSEPTPLARERLKAAGGFSRATSVSQGREGQGAVEPKRRGIWPGRNPPSRLSPTPRTGHLASCRGTRDTHSFLQSRTTAGPASPAGGRGSNGCGERLDKTIGRLVFYCATGDFRKSSVLVQASLAASGSYVFPLSSKNPCCAFV